jgi:cytoplasmic iron level regulating protein YaaA (DUF328/UPF0246 family)
MNTYINNVYTNSSPNINHEFEVRFGTKGIKYLTKMDYDNVIKKLKSLKWETNYTNGEYLLRIQPEFLDVRTGQFKTNSDFNRFRTEIQGLNNIQEYCKTNSLKIVNDKNYQSVKINRIIGAYTPM